MNDPADHRSRMARYGWYGLILPTIIFAGAVASVIWLDNNRNAWIELAAFTSPGLISILLSWIYRSTSKRLSLLLLSVGTLTLVTFIAQVLRSSTDLLDLFSDDSIKIALLTVWCTTSIIVLAAGTFLAFKPAGRRTLTAEGLDLDPIRQGLLNIKVFVREVQDATRKEASAIDHAVRRFEAALASQEKRFEKLQEEIAAARREAQSYKRIAEVTDGQREALLQLMTREKQRDRVIAFVLGLLSSLLAQALIYMGLKLME